MRGVDAQRQAARRRQSRFALVTAIAPPARVATTDDLRLPAGIVLFVLGAFVFLLFIGTVVILPVRVLPTRVAVAVDGRRETLMFVALCALSFALVLVLLAALALS